MTHDSVSEVAKIINCLPGTSEAHGEVAAKIMNLLASREQTAAENAARACVKAVEEAYSSQIMYDTYRVGRPPNQVDVMEKVISSVHSAAAPFLNGK